MSSPSEPATTNRPAGVIHDLGYRPYGGPRLSDGQVAWSFFVTGLRNTYGLGRSGRSKVLPMIMLGMMLLPALILVGVLVQARKALDLDSQLVSYSSYNYVGMSGDPASEIAASGHACRRLSMTGPPLMRSSATDRSSAGAGRCRR